ncbi:MAG: hypothetical protein C5B50_26870 [Verrucomicrobia bacterium]|nr:MAG: hypothetical protein C5B50_26870 [Verrucomicrobiota bacterium]
MICLLLGGFLLLPRLLPSQLSFAVARRLGIAVDEATAQLPRLGGYKEFEIEDPGFDSIIYYFDGKQTSTPKDMLQNALKAIRKRGFKSSKKMMLIICCNLSTTDKSYAAVYPYGLFVEANAIRNRHISLTGLVSQPLIKGPMNWDRRVNEWIYKTNNLDNIGLEVVENPAYKGGSTPLAPDFRFGLDLLTNKAHVLESVGIPRYFVREKGTYSEVYAIEDTNRSQVGTVRIWYEGDSVTHWGCYMEHK